MKDPPHEIYIIDQRESKRLHYTRRTVDKGLGPLRKKTKGKHLLKTRIHPICFTNRKVMLQEAHKEV